MVALNTGENLAGNIYSIYFGNGGPLQQFAIFILHLCRTTGELGSVLPVCLQLYLVPSCCQQIQLGQIPLGRGIQIQGLRLLQGLDGLERFKGQSLLLEDAFLA